MSYEIGIQYMIDSFSAIDMTIAPNNIKITHLNCQVKKAENVNINAISTVRELILKVASFSNDLVNHG